MSKLITLTDETFEKEIVETKGIALVDFSATWCGPCKQLHPIVESLAESYDGKAIFCTLDIGENQKTSIRFNIMSVPTIIMFKDGLPKEQINGLVPRERLEKSIDALLG